MRYQRKNHEAFQQKRIDNNIFKDYKPKQIAGDFDDKYIEYKRQTILEHVANAKKFI